MISKIDSFNTDIQDLLDKQDKDTVFLSTWDKNDEILNFDFKILEKSISNTKNINTYLMSKSLLECKKILLIILNAIEIQARII